MFSHFWKCEILCSALLLLVSFVAAAPAADLIANLPGFGSPTPSVGRQYSGFLPADNASTVFLHYWFSEASEVDPAIAPVVVWMNGGPGCSSLGGFFYEQGPFTFTGEVDRTGLPLLMKNTQAWSTISNMLFIEHPIGVGFSYARNGSRVSNDFIQSQNTYGFMLSFFKAFPEYSKNPFFITGESYAGIYVPTLANRIRLGNLAGEAYINLKGFAVGNGCIGGQVGTCSNDPKADKYLLDVLFGHGMIAQTSYWATEAACEPFTNHSAACNVVLRRALREAGSYDVYNVYDICGNDNINNDQIESESVATAPLAAPNQVFSRNGLADPIVCIPSAFAVTYLDDPAVRRAIHVENTTVTRWADCSRITYSSNLDSLLPLYPTLIANYRVLIYSGDADACVPWTDSDDWTRHLYSATPRRAWHPWNYAGGAYTGGFAVDYNANFTFLTVKHAGHLVPQYEPEASLHFFTEFLAGNPL